MTEHRLLPRFRRAQQDAEQAEQLAEILLETGLALPERSAPQAYALGDARQLRGIPTVGGHGGAGGAIAGTRPGASRELDAWSGRSA